MTSRSTSIPRTLWIAALLLLALPGFTVLAEATDRSFDFRQDGSRYTFTSGFVVAASPEQVLSILFPVDDLRQYSRREATVDLIDDGPGWQLVRFTHATLLWSFSATVRREIGCAGRCIRFQMLRTTRSGLPIPTPTASSGECRLEPTDTGVRVTIVQNVEAPDTPLLGLWTAWARSRARAFSMDLESHVRSRLHEQPH
jgi:hypothetical protein